MLKIILRSWAKCRKCWKQPVACVFSSKIAKNSISLASDERKTRKTACRSCFFIENYQKQRFACERQAKNAENSLSLVFFSLKIVENSVSLASDERKMGKIVLRGTPKDRNSEKQCFGMPRRVVFCENEPSGSPEASKFWKTSFRGAPKPQNFEKQAFGESRSSKNLKSESSGCPEKAKLDISKRKVKPKEWKRRMLIAEYYLDISFWYAFLRNAFRKGLAQAVLW